MSQATLPPGTALNGGAFQVKKLLGSGGFGNVYLATDKQGINYAIKEVFDRARVKRAANGLDVQPLAHPASAAQIHAHQCRGAHEEAARFSSPALRHPNLVQVKQCFDECGTAFLVMPYIEGKSLAQALSSPAANTLAWRMTLLRQIGAALDCLHRNGLIHRDLKPDNLLVTGSDDHPVPILLDTGSARTYGNGDSVHTKIMTDYGAPEIVSDVEERLYGKPGPATDCFALAGIAFLVFSGVKPLGFAQRVSLSLSIGGDPLGQPASMDAAVWRVLQRSLTLAVANRHQTASALVSALDAALSPTTAITAPLPLHVPTPAPTIPPDIPGTNVATDNLAARWVLAVCLTAAVCLALWAASAPGWGAAACLGFLVIHVGAGTLALRRGVATPLALTPVLNLYAMGDEK